MALPRFCLTLHIMMAGGDMDKALKLFSDTVRCWKRAHPWWDADTVIFAMYLRSKGTSLEEYRTWLGQRTKPSEKVWLDIPEFL